MGFYVMLPRGIEFAGGVKVAKSRTITGYLVKSNVITRVVNSERQRRENQVRKSCEGRSKGRVRTQQRALAGGDGGKGEEPRSVGSLQQLAKERKQILQNCQNETALSTPAS